MHGETQPMTEHEGLFLPCPHCGKVLEIRLKTVTYIPTIEVYKVKEEKEGKE